MAEKKEMKLNLGSGENYLKGYINTDICKNVKYDKYLDIDKIPWDFEDNSVDEILCTRVIEYINLSIIDFLKECYRILKPNGKIHLEFANPFFWRNRIGFIFGKLKSSAFHYQRKNLLHPSFVRELMKQSGFKIYYMGKTGLKYMPRSMSELNFIIKANKMWF